MGFFFTKQNTTTVVFTFDRERIRQIELDNAFGVAQLWEDIAYHVKYRVCGRFKVTEFRLMQLVHFLNTCRPTTPQSRFNFNEVKKILNPATQGQDYNNVSYLASLVGLKTMTYHYSYPGKPDYEYHIP